MFERARKAAEKVIEEVTFITVKELIAALNDLYYESLEQGYGYVAARSALLARRVKAAAIALDENRMLQEAKVILDTSWEDLL